MSEFFLLAFLALFSGLFPCAEPSTVSDEEKGKEPPGRRECAVRWNLAARAAFSAVWAPWRAAAAGCECVSERWRVDGRWHTSLSPLVSVCCNWGCFTVMPPPAVGPQITIPPVRWPPRACVLHRFPAWAFSGTFPWIYRDRLGGSDCRCVAVLSSNAAGDQSRARCRSACCLSGIPVPCGRAAQWLRARVMSGIILGESEFRHTGSGKSKNPSHRAGSPRGTKLHRAGTARILSS